MPISRSKLEAALRKMQLPAPQQAQTDLERLLERVTLLKGDKGDKGNKGDPGRTPIKYVDYFTDKEIEYLLKMATPKKGRDYFDGEKGDKGEDSIVPGPPGKDGNANLDEIHSIAEAKMEKHEKMCDHKLIHDPKILGKLELDESSAIDGKFLKVEGKKIVGVDAPKQQIIRQQYHGGGESRSRYRIKTITSSTTLDPLDDVILVDASAGNITLTFYATAGNEGSHHFIKRIDTVTDNTVSFAMTGSDTLDSQTLYQLVNFGSGAEVFGNGVSSWYFKHA